MKANEDAHDFIGPELLARSTVKNHPAMPMPVSTIGQSAIYDNEAVARIRAVGVGPFGIGSVQLLSHNLPGIICHEITLDAKGECSEQMADLLASVRESDLLFVLTGFDAEYCEAVAKAIGHAAREAGVLTLAIVSGKGDAPTLNFVALTEFVDVVFYVSECHITDNGGGRAFREEPLLQMVSAITGLIHQHSFIGVDFADIAMIMRGGKTGRIGVGISSSPSKGGNAALMALDQLAGQGVRVIDATGVLVIVQGSSQLTMDDFEDVSGVIHKHIAEDANVIVGIVTDDHLRDNVRVSVMAVMS